MAKLGYMVFIGLLISIILLFGFYVFPDIICKSILANGNPNNKGTDGTDPSKDPILQFCIAVRR